MRKAKGPIKRGTMHNALRSKQNQMRAGMARMQSKDKLWKKVNKVRKSTAGTEKSIKFYTVVDRARENERRAGKKTTMSLKAWMFKLTKGIRSKATHRRKAN